MTGDGIRGFLTRINGRPENIKTDSRDIRKGDIFVALDGTAVDGHRFIKSAIAAGAVAVVCRHIPEDLSEDEKKICTTADDTRKALGLISKKIFNDPSSKLKVFGITGTSGKTTDAFLIRDILNNSGVKCGLVSTVFNVTGGESARSSMTTPDNRTLNALLADMVDNGLDAAAIEVSSHGLNQDRAYGISLCSAVFTNISPEHMDYHKTMSAYLADKSKIFSLLSPGSVGHLNADDPIVASLSGKIEGARTVLYGIDSKADITAENVSTTLSGSAFDIRSEFGKLHIESKLIGRHNVYNILSCVSSLLYAGIGRDKVIQGIMKAGGVPGRLELIESRAPFKVFVDYAHKPNALENVLNCLKAVPHKRMICVFGCGGNRDRTKRPVMGQIAVAKSDMAIVTSDNPRDEDPEAIIREIVDGIKGCGNYRQVTAREEAIKEALHFAGKDDIVLIAGKGHEDYQIAGGRTVHFDDREIAAKELRIMGF